MIDYLNQTTLLGPTQERPTRTSQLLLEGAYVEYQSTPTWSPYYYFRG